MWRKSIYNYSRVNNMRELVSIEHRERWMKCGIPSTPLNLDFTQSLCETLKHNLYNIGDRDFLLELFKDRIVPGVDPTTYEKAKLLNDICNERVFCDIISKNDAVKILGTMQGGYNIDILTNLLDNEELAQSASNELKQNILIFDNIHKIKDKNDQGNPYAKDVLKSWANAEWFLNRPELEKQINLTVFKVTGETNTDDLSPAVDAWSRPDIPLHALSMLKNPRDGIVPNIDGEFGPIDQINELKQKGNQLVYVGDVVGTGSSRKSATNSILWHFGNEINHVPNKKYGGFCFGGKISPIFFNTMEDSGALPIEMDVSKMNMGDTISLHPYEGVVCDEVNNIISEWKLKTPSLLDSVRAGGRINLIIGKSLTNKSQEMIGDYNNSIFIGNNVNTSKDAKYTLAQKIVGKACNLPGILPGSYCEPTVTSVGSQDTTGPMTRNELKDLACTGFTADLVMQSFCHTAAYPKDVDIETQKTLPEFIHNRGGISLKPGDGIIHSWLNRMLLPDTVGTGGDSHTRFPIGISFPGGSGLVAFAAATGVMPLDMPESVLVRFKGKMQPGITLRDLVHAIPYYAQKKGLLTLDKKGKKNIFSGNILEIEGLEHLTCEQAFELSDASAERSSSGCTIKLGKESVEEYLRSNISLLKWMIKSGYQDETSIRRRINKMEGWLKEPVLLRADEGAIYKEIIEIDMDEITEPILCAPNDPDKTVLLSEVQGTKIDEVFIGSCMTNIGHFKASAEILRSQPKLNSKLWIAPPTKMDEQKLKEENYYSVFEEKNVRTEIPGCSLCMGNQARVEDKSTVVSTSTRNFPNRLGKGANVFLSSAELAAITSVIGKIPTPEEYMELYNENVKEKYDDIFTYLNFDKLSEYNR